MTLSLSKVNDTLESLINDVRQSRFTLNLNEMSW